MDMASAHDDTHTLPERQNNVSQASLSIKVGMQLSLLTTRWQCWPSLEAMLHERCVPFSTGFSVDVWFCVEEKNWGNQSDVYHTVHFCNSRKSTEKIRPQSFVRERRTFSGIMSNWGVCGSLARGNTQFSEYYWWLVRRVTSKNTS